MSNNYIKCITTNELKPNEWLELKILDLSGNIHFDCKYIDLILLHQNFQNYSRKITFYSVCDFLTTSEIWSMPTINSYFFIISLKCQLNIDKQID